MACEEENEKLVLQIVTNTFALFALTITFSLFLLVSISEIAEKKNNNIAISPISNIAYFHFSLENDADFPNGICFSIDNMHVLQL